MPWKQTIALLAISIFLIHCGDTECGANTREVDGVCVGFTEDELSQLAERDSSGPEEAAQCVGPFFLFGSPSECRYEWNTCSNDYMYQVQCTVNYPDDDSWNCNCIENDITIHAFNSENFCGNITDGFRTDLTNTACGWAIQRQN